MRVEPQRLSLDFQVFCQALNPADVEMVPGEASLAVVMALGEELQLLGVGYVCGAPWLVLQVCFPCPG